MLVAVVAATCALAGCGSSSTPAAHQHSQRTQHTRQPDVSDPPQHGKVGTCASAGVITGAGGGCPMLADPGYTVCLRTFLRHRVLGWESTTVAQLRSYQFGGPIAHRPLQHAFPGSARTRLAAWCLLRDGPNTASLWGTLASGRRQHAITISGPGAADYRGPMTAPPQVP
jgi:hypothetical protein